MIYLIVYTEQAGTLVSHSLSDLRFGCVTIWRDFCNVRHAVDANSVIWPWNVMEHPLYRQVLALMTVLPPHNIVLYKYLCVKLEWFILCVVVTYSPCSFVLNYLSNWNAYTFALDISVQNLDTQHYVTLILLPPQKFAYIF